jgi:hypothetical protein
MRRGDSAGCDHPQSATRSIHYSNRYPDAESDQYRCKWIPRYAALDFAGRGLNTVLRLMLHQLAQCCGQMRHVLSERGQIRSQASIATLSGFGHRALPDRWLLLFDRYAGLPDADLNAGLLALLVKLVAQDCDHDDERTDDQEENVAIHGLVAPLNSQSAEQVHRAEIVSSPTPAPVTIFAVRTLLVFDTLH